MRAYLTFKDVTAKDNKKFVIQVYSNTKPALMGVIKWSDYWSCYAYWPTTRRKTLLNRSCLKEIDVQIRKLKGGAK